MCNASFAIFWWDGCTKGGSASMIVKCKLKYKEQLNITTHTHKFCLQARRLGLKKAADSVQGCPGC